MDTNSESAPVEPIVHTSPEDTVLRGSPAKTSTTEAQPNRPKVKEHEISATGGNREVTVSNETRLALIPLMQRQRQEAQGKATTGEKLTILEEHLLKTQILSNIESGAIGKAEMATMYSALTIELSQIDTSTQYSATEAVPERRRWQRLRRQQPEPQVTVTQNTENPRVITDSIRRRGLNNLESPEDIQNYTRELAQAAIDLQTSLFGREIGDPILGRFTSSQFEFGLATTDSNFYNATREKATQLLEQRHNGVDFNSLHKEDPTAGAAIWLEAQQQALPEFTEVYMREILQIPGIDIGKIDHHINTLKKPPSPEDLKNDEEIVEAAKNDFESANTEYDELNNKLKDLNSQIETLQTEFESADEEFRAAQETLTLSKSYWEDIIRDNDRHITTFATAINTPIPPGATAQQVQAIKKSNETLSAQMNAAEARKTEARKKLSELQEAVAKAKAKKETRDTKLRTLTTERDTIEDPTDPTAGKLEVKRLERATKETDWKTKDKDLKDKRNSQSERKLTPEQQKQVDALEMWKTLVDDKDVYGKIIDARFGNKEDGDEFTLTRLASVREVNGQIEGAEFIREHIFSFIDISKQNPELAREMVSDESLARAIIYTYNLDLKKITSSSGSSLENLIYQLELRKNSLKRIPERNTQQREQARSAVRDMAQQLISTVLPHISSSEYAAGKLLRFIVRQGLKSAEKGNPYLEVDKYFETQKADIQVSPDTIRIQNIGTAEVHDRNITYEQPIPDSVLSRTHGTTLPIDYRVTETYDRDQVTVRVQAAVNERLFESLPDTIAGTAGMNPELYIFYDKNGDLRTELRGKDRRAIWDRIRRGQILGFTIPDYIDLVDNQYTNIPGGQSASEQALNYISTLSPSAEGMYTVAIANGVLQQNPETRLQEIRGFSVTMPIDVITSDTGDTKKFTLDFENDGNFYISDITDPVRPQRMELNHYFKKRTEEYMTNLGIQALSTEDQSALQNEFATILMPIGNEVRLAQQRR